MSICIVISGKSGHGKDEAANYICEELNKKGLRCDILHFGDLVKFFCQKMYGWNGEKDTFGRGLLQKVGTDEVRHYFPNYWAEAVSCFVAATSRDRDVVIIPDARFPNEIDVMKDHNPIVYTLRIERFNQDGSKYINPKMTDIQHKHESETSLDFYKKFDFVIPNHTLKDFHQRIDKVMLDIGLFD